jgi:hypothetical protein
VILDTGATPADHDGQPSGAREVTYLFADEPLVCTAGHAIESDFWVLGDAMYIMGGARCDFIEPVASHGGRPLSAKEARQYRCNRTVLFVRAHGITVVARVSPRELAEMQKQRMTASQIRAHLGLDWRARHQKAG